MPKATTDTTPKATADGIDVHCAHTELVDPASLTPNPRNPNQHDDRQIDLLARIIKAQGWRSPIGVSTRSGFVVRGHGRLMAAQHLGVTQVPIDRQDYASEADEWADVIADNRIAELSNIDPGLMIDLVDRLDDEHLSLTGYDDDGLRLLRDSLDLPDDDAMAAALGGVVDGEPEFITMTFSIPADAKPDVDEALATAKSIMGDVDGNVNGHALVALCRHHLTGE